MFDRIPQSVNGGMIEVTEMPSSIIKRSLCIIEDNRPENLQSIMLAGLLPLSKDRCELATIDYRGYAHLALSQVKTTAVGGNLIACSSMSVDRAALCPIRLRLTNDPTRLRTSHKSDNLGHFIHFPNSLQET